MYKIFVTNENTLKELIQIYNKWNYTLVNYSGRVAELEKENAKKIIIITRG